MLDVHVRQGSHADRSAADALEPHPEVTESWNAMADLVAQEVARGRIVARLVEDKTYRPRRIYVIARADGRGCLVTDDGGSRWGVYLAPSVEVAEQAGRWILASGIIGKW